MPDAYTHAENELLCVQTVHSSRNTARAIEKKGKKYVVLYDITILREGLSSVVKTKSLKELCVG